MAEEIQGLCQIVDHIKSLEMDPNVKPLVSLVEERNAYQFESLSEERALEKDQDSHTPVKIGQTLINLSVKNMRNGIYFSAKKSN